MYGFVIGHYPEWGYFQISELETIRGPGGLRIERDLSFKAQKISHAAPEHFPKQQLGGER